MKDILEADEVLVVVGPLDVPLGVSLETVIFPEGVMVAETLVLEVVLVVALEGIEALVVITNGTEDTPTSLQISAAIGNTSFVPLSTILKCSYSPVLLSASAIVQFLLTHGSAYVITPERPVVHTQPKSEI